MATSAVPQQSLAGKTAIVTGASRGIGHQIALELATRGAKVVATYSSDRSAQSVAKLAETVAALGNGAKVTGIQANLSGLDAPRRIVQYALTSLETATIDILVNNAATDSVKALPDISVADFNYVYDLNVRAPLLLTQAVLPVLRKPGRIINISSGGARGGYAMKTLYCSSKAALEGMTRCLAAELGADGTTVNCVDPGPVQTELMDLNPKGLVEGMKAATPLEHRLGGVDDIAQVVAFLTEDGGRWITGQCIAVNGGLSMY